MKYILSIAGALVIGLILGHVMTDPVEIRTVQKEVIVNPDFEFEPGDKTFCDLGVEVKPCEIVGRKSSGTYAIKYTHTGIAGGEKIIVVNASQILK